MSPDEPASGSAQSPARQEPGSTAAASIARWRRQRLLASTGLSALLLAFLALPPALLALNHQRIPIPFVLSAFEALIAFATMTAVHRLLSNVVSPAVRTIVGVCVAAALGGAASILIWKIAARVPLMDVTPASGAGTLGRVAAGVVFTAMAVGMWSIAILAPANWEQQRIRSLEMENLRLEAAEMRTAAEMAGLRAQLEPHFLLNTLNLVSGLVEIDATKARHVLACLGDLLRDVLVEHGETHRIDDEIAWLRRYCEILEIRHGNALAIEWEISPETLDALIPRMMLQPLVENAIRHGALRRRGGGAVAIRVKPSSPGWLSCVVEDNGPGVMDETREGAIGVRSVRRRLELTCPGATFSLSSTPEGTRASIVMPRAGASTEQQGKVRTG